MNTVVYDKLREVSKYHPFLFSKIFEWLVLLNVITSLTGGMLWVMIWGAANDVNSANELYTKLQPLSTIPEWIPQVISYIFVATMLLNSILMILWILGYMDNEKK